MNVPAGLTLKWYGVVEVAIMKQSFEATFLSGSIAVLLLTAGCSTRANMYCAQWEDRVTGPQGQTQMVCDEWLCEGGYEMWDGKCITHEEAMKRKYGSS